MKRYTLSTRVNRAISARPQSTTGAFAGVKAARGNVDVTE